MAIPITQAQIEAAPGNFRFLVSGDYYFAEPLHYPYSFGMAMQNETPLGLVRIFTRGFFLTSPGLPNTQADGINIFNTKVEIYGGGVSGFRDNLQLSHHPGFPAGPGQHVISQFTSLAAKQRGVHAYGDDNMLDRVTVKHTGGGAVAYRPIGIQNVGARPRLSKCTVHNMIKGPSDIETMNYHIDSCGNGGFMIDCEGVNYAKQTLSFGMWFNAPDGSLLMRGGKFGSVETVLAGTLGGGDFRAECWDYDNPSNLVGPTVTIS